MLSVILNFIFALLVLLLLLTTSPDLLYIKLAFLISIFIFIFSFMGKNKLSFFYIFSLCIIGLFYVGNIVSIFFDWGSESTYLAHKTFSTMTLAGFHLLTGSYLVVLNVLGSSKPVNKKVVVDFTYAKKKLTWSIFFLAFAISIFLYFNFGALLDTTRAEVKSLGFVGYFSYIMFFLAITYSLSGILFRFEQRKFKYLYLYYLFISMLLAFIAFKTRTGLLLPLSSFAFGYFILAEMVILKNGLKSQVVKSINKLKLLVFMSIAFIFIVSMRFVRGLMETGSTDFNISVVLERTFNGGDLGYGVTSTKVIDFVLQRDFFLYGDSYLRFFYLFVPRALWEEKPVSTQRIVGEWLMPNVQNMTIPPGFFTDFFINFGFFGLILCLYFGVIFALLDNISKKRINYLFYLSLSFTFLFHMARGALVNPFVGAIVSLVGAILIIHLFKIKEVK